MNKTVRNRTDRKTYLRLAIAFCFFIGMALLIIGRLAKYQLKDYAYYQSQVLNQLTTEVNVNPERGDITDRNGVVLATNKSVYNVIISPKHISEKNKEIEKNNSDGDKDNDIKYEWTSEDGKASYYGTEADEFIAKFLSYTLDVDYSLIREKMTKTDRQYEVIKNNVDETVDVKVREFISKNNFEDQVYDRESSKRYYPYGSLASHVIGFTNSEGVGRDGIEAFYNNILEGKSGKYVQAHDAKNNDMPFEYETYISEENGYNIVTTIDKYIQSALENQLEMTYYDSGAGNRVTGIVMDVKTGGILGMATYPAFDLNSPYTLDEDSQTKLSQYEEGTDEYDDAFGELLFTMWKNKAITELYEPGSTFKIMTTAMALEEKLITFDDEFYCGGEYFVEGWSDPINCHYTAGHGWLKYRYGLQQSCNPALMQVAEKIGTERFFNYFEALGYTSTTGIDLPGEAKGITASRSNFGNVSLAVYSFGQTFKTTPIQQLTAIATIANGGYALTPHVLKEIVDDDGNVVKTYETNVKRQVISSDVCEEITIVLEDGVSGDGGAKNAYVKGYKVAAKTGTSEKRDKYDENGVKSFRVGSCAAYAPMDDPQIAAIIIVDEPMKGAVYGSVVAAPYISNLLATILPYLGVEQQYTEEDLATLDVLISDYVGGSPSAAKDDLALRGLECEIIGDGDIITSQFPVAGSTMRAENGKVIIYCGETSPRETTVVPDILNLTADAANKVLIGAELNMKITGATNGSSATVISQYPEAGTEVEVGTIVQFELRHMDVTD
ncbi:MAG: PASTA domain-containing protein [Clostridia bacterium]|nr:PASTA domain-containing protein [Clostridia bacterium]